MKKINALSAMRLAMHGDVSFERHVRDLADRIEMLEYREQTDDEILQNWEAKTAELKAAMIAMKGMRRN